MTSTTLIREALHAGRIDVNRARKNPIMNDASTVISETTGPGKDAMKEGYFMRPPLIATPSFLAAGGRIR